MRAILSLILCCNLLAAASLEDAFARAEYDPAAVVPLVVAAGARLRELPPGEAVVLADRLQPFLQRLYFSSELFPGMEALGLISYRVQPGDHFARIAKAHGVGSDHLQAINPLVTPDSMQVGEELKVLDCTSRELRIYVWRSRFRMLVTRSGANGDFELLAIYPIGVGKTERPTPLGTTTVALKQRDPTWTDPDTKQVFAPDDPGNVLNGFWIGLEPGADGRFKGIGFHGYTGAPSGDWIGRGGSRGCVRMLKADIGQVFNLVITGLPVAIMD
jgi:hypothetical protein